MEIEYTPPAPVRWTTTVATYFPRTGFLKPDSLRVFRSTTPPPCTRPEGTTPEKFYGPPTRVRVLRAVAHASWDVVPGVFSLPSELADYLIVRGHARLARAHEWPADE